MRDPIHEKVLNYWAAGMTSVEIAALFGFKRPQVACTIVARARIDGDPRAKRRHRVHAAAPMAIPAPKTSLDTRAKWAAIAARNAAEASL